MPCHPKAGRPARVVVVRVGSEHGSWLEFTAGTSGSRRCLVVTPLGRALRSIDGRERTVGLDDGQTDGTLDLARRQAGPAGDLASRRRAHRASLRVPL